MSFYVYKYGQNADVDGVEDVWDAGSYYLFPTVAFQTQIVGGASDMVGSDGVHSVQIEGLDINGAEVTEVATLTHTTPVTLANSYYRVNRAYVLKTGGVEVNSFDISISHTGSATLARISAQQGQTLQAVYTVPANVRGTVKKWECSANRAATKTDVAGTIVLQTRKNGESWRTKSTMQVTNGSIFVKNFDGAAVTVDPLTDIRVRMTAVNTNDLTVSADFEITGMRDIR